MASVAYVTNRSCLVLSFVAGLAWGCGPGGRADEPDARDVAPTPDARRTVDAPPVIPPSLVYAHSGTELFRINTQNLEAARIGALTGLGVQNLTDLAVSRDDRLVGITMNKLVDINPITGECTVLVDLSASAQGFTSLSFVPTNLSDPGSVERLVAANSEGAVFEINLQTGAATQLGSYGEQGGNIIRSSGDLVAVSGAGIFATVNLGDDFASSDHLALIDPVTWKATLIGPPSVDKLFGLAYWAGQLYGFVDHGFDAGTGAIWKINPQTGAAEEILQSNVRWFGAGVTTDAPIIE